MAFDLYGARGYGTEKLGNVTNPADINHYARVTAHSDKTITVDGDDLDAFTPGTEILLHLSAAKSSSANAKHLGKYLFAKIMSRAGNVLTLSAAPLDLNANNFFIQAVTVPHYKTLTLSNTISPPAFNPDKGYGGILIFKATRLNFNGAINLVDKGLTENSQRPLLAQETEGTLDTDKLSGYENYDCSKHFTLQKGDGACMILAKRIDFEDTARIGDPSLQGVQRTRSTSTASNVGGSSILIVADTINDFDAKIIAKYRSNTREAGRGLARAYIATESRLPNDEGLYAYDIINKPERLAQETLINDFGSGSLGVAKNLTKQQNNYAKVSKISSDGKTFTLINQTTEGVAAFERNALIMIHAAFKSSSYFAAVGRFFISKCVGITNDTSGKLTSVTLANSISELGISNFDLSHYNFQAVTIPQYKTFINPSTTITINKATPKYDKGRGGIFALAVSDTCDLRHFRADVSDKGGSQYNLTNVSNARMKNRLPIGAGHGSVFILAKTLLVDDFTRLGSQDSGNGFGGTIDDILTEPGGWQGRDNFSTYHGWGAGGSGKAGGSQKEGHVGGFCSNSSDGAAQGASLLIVAQSIDGLSLDCLCTGGEPGFARSKYAVIKHTARAGGCGYGGAGGCISYKSSSSQYGRAEHGGQGGIHGGGGGASSGIEKVYDTASVVNYTSAELWISGGGASGFCSVYCNQFTNQDTSNLSFD